MTWFAVDAESVVMLTRTSSLFQNPELISECLRIEE